MRLSICILLVMAAVGFAEEEQKAAALPAQAEPVMKQLEAVIEGDTAQLKGTYSRKLQERIEKKHTWEEVVQLYGRAMKDQLGEYKLDDFSYSYAKTDETHGVVGISFKGKSLKGGDKRVILEDGKWRVNEK